MCSSWTRVLVCFMRLLLLCCEISNFDCDLLQNMPKSFMSGGCRLNNGMTCARCDIDRFWKGTACCAVINFSTIFGDKSIGLRTIAVKLICNGLTTISIESWLNFLNHFWARFFRISLPPTSFSFLLVLPLLYPCCLSYSFKTFVFNLPSLRDPEFGNSSPFLTLRYCRSTHLILMLYGLLTCVQSIVHSLSIIDTAFWVIVTLVHEASACCHVLYMASLYLVASSQQ